LKLIVKIALGIILALFLLMAGCAALIGVGVSEAKKESNKTAITAAQYRHVHHGETRKALVARFGVPADDQDFSASYGGITSKSSCIYYHRQGELVSLYQFCFDNGKLNSKASY
jgi:hypothetical protein